MSYTTKVIYSTDSHFTNTQNVTESGKPASVELENLASNQNYYTKAELRDNNGTLLDTSNVSTFQTLAAGTISLTYVSTTRSGNNYIASYTYTSTYALSSAIMSINSINVQGIIAGNNITFTISGLTHGDAYLYTITATDIYTETGTLSGSITTTVVNEVAITSTVAAETSMRLNLSYQTDSGFRSGYGECWAMGDDPDTDQPESYAFFNEGDTYVVVPNINADTQYQFRATIELDNSTEVYSSVVVARTTTHDYSQDYFTIKNESNSSNTITLNAQNYGLYSNAHFYVSEDDGSTWTDKEINSTSVNLATIGSGRKLLIKHSGYISIATQYMGTLYSIISCSADYSVSGNVASLIYGDNFTSKPQTSFGIGYERLFYNDTHLVYAGNLVLTEDNNSTGEDFHSMFYGCTSLTTPPDTSRLTSLPQLCFYNAFCNCTSLTTAPDLSNVTTVGNSGMNQMFRNCTSLTTAPDLGNITSLSNSCMLYMFAGCIALTAMPELNATTLAPNCYQNMFEGCVSLTQTTKLPAKTIESSSYSMMFQKCTSLKTGVDLLGVSVVNANGIYYMYNGCTSLTTAYAPAITWDTAKSKNWLQNVGASGTLYASWSIIGTIPSGDSSGSPSGWTKTGV